MAVLQVILIVETIFSLLAGYFFAGMRWYAGALFLFAALIADKRAGKRAKKKEIYSVRLRGRISDALIFAGVAVGTREFIAPGLLALFLVVFVPHITGRIRELRGHENIDVLRKYRLYVLLMAGLAERVYSGAMYAGLGAIIGLIMVDFARVLKEKK